MADLSKTSTLDAETLALLRRTGIERDEIGERLARHEYLALRRELQSPGAFSFQVDLGASSPPSAGLSDLQQPELDFDPALLATLPELPVPLGRIAWVKRPEVLPVTGVLIEQTDFDTLSQALLSLLAEHHQKPFARLVFLCRGLEPVHVLGRYGFIAHHVSQAELDQLGPILARRYGMSQIWSLQSGQRSWSRD